MVEPQPSKLMTWVRFPLPAPNKNHSESYDFFSINRMLGIEKESAKFRARQEPAETKAKIVRWFLQT